jgi:tripartite-type tricarboxylate transporter receptor subunit TctC
MKLPRRSFLCAAGAVALPTVPHLAWAQSYPSQPVRWIVPYPPGGPADIVTRLLGQWLSGRFGQPVIIENRHGAGTNIGTEAVVHAAPDGYTLLLVAPSSVINATLYDKLNFNFIHDIAPVALIMHTPEIMVVHPSLPAKTIPEFIAYAKANPGKINMASAGIGTSEHLSGELFKMMTDIDMVHVPYRGRTPAMTDLIAGRVQVMFTSPIGLAEYLKAGKLRALAVASATRSQALPDIPTVAEFVPGYQVSGWWGVGVPKNTPAAIIDKLNRAINAALADQTMKARLAELGGTVAPGSPADFGKLIAEETEKWGKVILAAGIKAE